MILNVKTAQLDKHLDTELKINSSNPKHFYDFYLKNWSFNFAFTQREKLTQTSLHSLQIIQMLFSLNKDIVSFQKLWKGRYNFKLICYSSKRSIPAGFATRSFPWHKFLKTNCHCSKPNFHLQTNVWTKTMLLFPSKYTTLY